MCGGIVQTQVQAASSPFAEATSIRTVESNWNDSSAGMSPTLDHHPQNTRTPARPSARQYKNLDIERAAGHLHGMIEELKQKEAA
jgi:hypothetical protein